MKEELKEGGFGREKIMERLVVVPEELDQKEKEKEDVHDQIETHEGRKVSSKYVILIIITLKKCVGYTILCWFAGTCGKTMLYHQEFGYWYDRVWKSHGRSWKDTVKESPYEEDFWIN